jgi:hypothetical protein
VAGRDDPAHGLPTHLRRGGRPAGVEAYALKHGLDHSVRIRAQSMTTDSPRTFEAHDMREVVGFSMAQDAARQVYEQAGISPRTWTWWSCMTALRKTNC